MWQNKRTGTGYSGEKLSEQFPVVEAATSFIPEINNYKIPDVPHIRLRTLNTDNTFFEVFKLQFVSGDMQQPLLTEFNLVLTESVAITLFGDVEKAIGQQIQSTFYFFHPPYTVTAVVKDPPANTNLPFDTLLNFDFGISTESEEIHWVQFFFPCVFETQCSYRHSPICRRAS
ncbi:MAG: ABC transporter permease [Tannerellaceae bacterium]|nr:ABC transporter permease [Tannerellaceae bacterium]